MNKLTDDRFKELKTLHIASKPELSKFKENVAAVIRKKDFHRLAVCYESVMCAFDSYDEVIDDLLDGVEEAREEVEGLKVVNRSQSRYTEEVQSRAHHYQVISEKLQWQLQDALNTLQEVTQKSLLYSAQKAASEAIQRIQEGTTNGISKG